MKSYKVSLKKEYGTEGGELECILGNDIYDTGAAEWRRPAVIVVPGGGYWMVSKREGEPVAEAFLARGFQTFVLTYLCRPDGVRYPEQLTELAAAVDYVKKHAEEMSVNPDEIFVVGFSAGGHLAGDLAVEWDCVAQKTGLELDCRPTAVGLSYPVISYDCGHTDSFENLLEGYTEEAKEVLRKELSLDSRVTESTAPAFIWTTAEDTCVPAENSMVFALALAKKKIPYELHVYPRGEHGSSVCNKEINIGGKEFLRKNNAWLDNCASFFRQFVKEDF